MNFLKKYWPTIVAASGAAIAFLMPSILAYVSAHPHTTVGVMLAIPRSKPLLRRLKKQRLTLSEFLHWEHSSAFSSLPDLQGATMLPVPYPENLAKTCRV